MKLHVGAFNQPIDGWVNTDVTPHIWVSRLPGAAELLNRVGRLGPMRLAEHRAGIYKKLKWMDASRAWPFGNGTLDAVFSSHVLEHLTYWGARNYMREAYRTLKIGGVLRIVVPDLDYEIKRYRSEKALEWALDFFEAGQAGAKNIHKMMYNEQSLRSLALEAGFSKVSRCSYLVGACPDIELLDNRPESLFFEAER